MEFKAKFGNVRCEFTPGLYDPDMHIDIAVFDKDALIPIELKYKTKEDVVDLSNNIITLKDQLAYNHACYDFWKDVKRIEDLKACKEYKVENGFAIFLTNAENYLKKPTEKPTAGTNYDHFRIYNGRKGVTGPLNWICPKAPAASGRPGPLDIKGNYDLVWSKSYNYSSKNGYTYHYLIVEI